ncbi:MAG: hypothetical protein N4A47_00125 [Clostridia bacterium]|jgi:hypothetical protein|nr:hypothetical protein [Clostridia bacterium]
MSMTLFGFEGEDGNIKDFYVKSNKEKLENVETPNFNNEEVEETEAIVE